MLHKYEADATSYQRRIGHSEAEFSNLNYFYHYPLVDKIGENLVVAHLNRLEAVKIILDSFDGAKDKEMLYFLKSGEMKIL